MHACMVKQHRMNTVVKCWICMYYGDCYKEREHLKYLVVDKRIILKLSSLGMVNVS